MGENMKESKDKSKSKFEIEVFVEKDNSKKKTNIVPNKTTVKDILKQLGILSSASIVTINNDIATDDDVVKEKDNVKILSVISGG